MPSPELCHGCDQLKDRTEILFSVYKPGPGGSLAQRCIDCCTDEEYAEAERAEEREMRKTARRWRRRKFLSRIKLVWAKARLLGRIVS